MMCIIIQLNLNSQKWMNKICAVFEKYLENEDEKFISDWVKD